MGSIMCIGVSVSNSVMLVTFMNEHWKAGRAGRDAAIVGAGERLRPILMTACAMVVGMIPMALGLERGSQMESPLGRAVIGGLVLSTFCTLLVVPAVFAVVIGSRKAQSPSLSPEHSESPHYDPDFEKPAADDGPAAVTVPQSPDARIEPDDAIVLAERVLPAAPGSPAPPTDPGLEIQPSEDSPSHGDGQYDAPPTDPGMEIQP